jgi:hypothetical protein
MLLESRPICNLVRDFEEAGHPYNLKKKKKKKKKLL